MQAILDGPRTGPGGHISERATEPKQTSNLNFRPLRPYFEVEEATSTTSAIHNTSVESPCECRILDTVFTYHRLIPEFRHQPCWNLVPKQTYRVRTGAKCSVSSPGIVQTLVNSKSSCWRLPSESKRQKTRRNTPKHKPRVHNTHVGIVSSLSYK
jgi:hypothetical protein